MFTVGEKVVYMKPHPWNDGGWWTDYPATVLGQTPAGRIRIQLDTGRKCAVKSTSIRKAVRVTGDT